MVFTNAGPRAGCRTPWDSREKVKIEEVFIEFPLSLEPFLAARFLGIRFKSILMHVAVAWCWTLSLFHWRVFRAFYVPSDQRLFQDQVLVPVVFGTLFGCAIPGVKGTEWTEWKVQSGQSERYRVDRVTGIGRSERIWDLSGDQIWDLSGYQIWNQSGDQIWDQSGDQIWGQSGDQIWDLSGDQIWGESRDRKCWSNLRPKCRSNLVTKLRWCNRLCRQEEAGWLLLIRCEAGSHRR